jgi:hypothetical protein
VNIDFPLANRALARVGADPLTWSDRTGESLRWRALLDCYLQTFLEALSEVDWTGGRKRKPLRLTGLPHGRVWSGFVYDLPSDCARPLELQNNAYFVIEGRFLCSDQERAELLYVSNGKTLRPIAWVSAGRPGNMPEAEPLSAGRPGDVSEATLRAGRPGDVIDYATYLVAQENYPADSGVGSPGNASDDATYVVTQEHHPAIPAPGEDYPDYRPPRYEPKFYEYLERVLALKLCALLAKDMRIHSQLLQEAMLVKEEAIVASRGASAAKLRPQKWWKEELGL